MAEKEYIAKEFVIDAIEELKTKPMPKALLFDHLTKLIEIFPTENFAPVRHGRWINENFYTRCSVCGNMAIYDKYGQGVESDYCPRCGAKMDGGDNE